MRRICSLMALFCVLFALTACDSFERTSFNTLSSSKAVIDTAQADYESRKLPKTACVQSLINDAKAAQTAGVNALLIYDQIAKAKGDASAQQQIVATDLSKLVGVIVEVKTLYTNPNCTAGAQ